jgi:hypothetical protein
LPHRAPLCSRCPVQFLVGHFCLVLSLSNRCVHPNRFVFARLRVTTREVPLSAGCAAFRGVASPRPSSTNATHTAYRRPPPRGSSPNPFLTALTNATDHDYWQPPSLGLHAVLLLTSPPIAHDVLVCACFDASTGVQRSPLNFLTHAVCTSIALRLFPCVNDLIFLAYCGGVTPPRGSSLPHLSSLQTPPHGRSSNHRG